MNISKKEIHNLSPDCIARDFYAYYCISVHSKFPCLLKNRHAALHYNQQMTRNQQ